MALPIVERDVERGGSPRPGVLMPIVKPACHEACVLKTWCLLSGGKDSMTVAHLLDQREELAGCLAIDTGISTPDWRPFIEQTCAEMDWPLVVVRTPESYEDLVMRYGFPGPDLHRVMFSALKGRGVRAFRKMHPGARLASGVRRRESQRRAQNVPVAGDFEGLPVVRPIEDWTTERVWAYVRAHGLPRSPAYETLHLSGDCLCGAYARPEEAPLLRMFYPTLAARLARLEAQVKPTGKPARWGHGMGATGAIQQTALEAFACDACTRSESDDEAT